MIAVVREIYKKHCVSMKIMQWMKISIKEIFKEIQFRKKENFLGNQTKLHSIEFNSRWCFSAIPRRTRGWIITIISFYSFSLVKTLYLTRKMVWNRYDSSFRCVRVMRAAHFPRMNAFLFYWKKKFSGKIRLPSENTNFLNLWKCYYPCTHLLLIKVRIFQWNHHFSSLFVNKTYFN